MPAQGAKLVNGDSSTGVALSIQIAAPRANGCGKAFPLFCLPVGRLAPADPPPALVERLNKAIRPHRRVAGFGPALEPDGTVPVIMPALFAGGVKVEVAR